MLYCLHRFVESYSSFIVVTYCYILFCTDDELDVPHEKLWKTEKFTPEDNKHSLVCETNYKTLFPRYREKYIEDIWPFVQKALGEVVRDMHVFISTMLIHNNAILNFL